MAISMVHEASTSISRCVYHVFFSFRGVDTRKNFTDHLYTALVQAGIHTFRDDEKIERGKNIKDEIEKAILHQSKISIIVFSRNYASSTWCLDELVKILEHRRSSQHIVLPIFYNVDPAEIKKQTGSYGEAFARHEESFKSEMDKVERWRAALIEVADLGGMVLQDRHESQFIEDTVKQVQNKLHLTALSVPPVLVGIDFLVTCINCWLEENGSKKVGIATIYGIGGIGKTTIAKVAYNQNIRRFESCSFLADVREVSQQCSGLVRLQKQLISDLTGKAKKIFNSDDGIVKIKEALCCRRVLFVLDDVDDSETITKIIGTQVPFHPGSRILITSRHRCMLNVPFLMRMLNLESPLDYEDICKEFEVKQLACTESLQLFNWYAFGGQGSAIESTSMEYAKRVVKQCGRLPLALKVLGSSLSGKSMSVWNTALEKLEAIPHSKIQKILRISYDSLEDDHDKNLFLDIACLFIGKDRDYTTTILDGCDYFTTTGIENLISRSLLIVNEKNKLMMHQMIKDMGREIIRQESSNLGKRSRLWHKDAFYVIREKIGTKTVKCFSIDLRGLQEDKSGKEFTSLHLVNLSKNIPFLNEVDTETEGFTKMHKLKLLQLDYVKLKGDYRNFPKGLIWLRWNGFPLKYFPADFDISRLVVLDMRKSKLTHVWQETKCLLNLKILNLNHSHDLRKTPNFSRLLSLEKLMLKNCIKLSEVDQSIGELRKLNFLNLKGCKSLTKLPNTVGKLVSLEKLILAGCSRLDNVPRELQNIKSLRALSLDETAIYDSNSCLSWLSLRRRKELNLFWVSLPRSLVNLSLENCKLSDHGMPNDLSGLPSLESLNLSRNPIDSLPESINSLTKLKELVLACCKELQSLPKLPITSSGLQVKISQSMDRFSSLYHLLSLKRCIIFGCEKLTTVEGFFKLEPIENVEVEKIRSLFNVDSIRRDEMQIYNYLTDTKIITAPQVIHECGITSCFVLGSEVPTSFEYRSKGSKISFCLPPSPYDPKEKISWLNICIMFSPVSGANVDDFIPGVAIANETKDIKFRYFTSFMGIPKSNDNKTMLWLIHCPATVFQLEDGDSVRLAVIVNPDNLYHVSSEVFSPFDTREIGVSCKSGSNNKFKGDFQQYYPENEDDERNMELDLTEDLLNLSSSGNIVNVEICNLLKEANMVASPQVLYDCGIISTVDPSHEIRLGCRGLSAVESKISFTVPQNSGRTVGWLQSRIYLSADIDKTFNILPRVEIVNETKGTKWTYCKHFTGTPEAQNRICWLSSWKFKGELGAGDHVSFTVLSDLRVEECAFDLVYESNNNLRSECNSTVLCSRAQTRWYHWYFRALAYSLFLSQRTLHRIQRLGKE